MTDLRLPHLGEGVTEARIVRWLKHEGQSVALDEPIVEVETDKVTAELPSPVTGVLLSILVPDDQLVPIGTAIARFTGDGRQAPVSSATSSVEAPAASAGPPGIQPVSESAREKPTPAVRALAAELGVDLETVSGTGPRGRITLEDVRFTAPASPDGAQQGMDTPARDLTVIRARSRDGTEIAAVVTGSGPPLLLVHGMSADHTVWNSAARTLAASFTVYAMDRRGRGLSGDQAEYRLEREREDLEAIITAIGGPVDVVAHSYGALCLLEAALSAPGVKRLVLYEPPIGASLPLVSAPTVGRLKALLKEGRHEELLTAFLADALWQTGAEIEAQRHRPEWRSRVVAAHSIVRELVAVDQYAFRPSLFQTLQVPTLLLVGANSRLGVATSTFELASTLPRAWIAVLAGQSHVAMIRAPELFAARVHEFLR